MWKSKNLKMQHFFSVSQETCPNAFNCLKDGKIFIVFNDKLISYNIKKWFEGKWILKF